MNQSWKTKSHATTKEKLTMFDNDVAFHSAYTRAREDRLGP